MHGQNHIKFVSISFIPRASSFCSSSKLFGTRSAEPSDTPELAWRYDAHVPRLCQGIHR